jgi:hypothetical protein
MLETFGELLGASVPLLCEDGPDGVRAKPLPPGNKDTIGGEYNSKGLQEARHLVRGPLSTLPGSNPLLLMSLT